MIHYKYDIIEPNSQRWLSLQDLPNEEWQDAVREIYSIIYKAKKI